MTGRVIIVTGANTGIGFETARYLCEGGNDVILACRDEEKALRAISRIKAQNANALATYIHLDLGDLESIRKFVGAFVATGKKLHVLINNAGMMLAYKDHKRQFTKDNFEITMGTNYLGPFLLTNLLLDELKKTGAEEGGDSRILFLTSSVHDPKCSKKCKNLQPFDLDNFFLFNDGTHSGLQAYKNSQVALIAFAQQLSKKLENTGVKVNCVCPGTVAATELHRQSSGVQKVYTKYVMHGIMRIAKVTRTAPQAAVVVSTLATDEKYKDVTGKYFKEQQEIAPGEETTGDAIQTKLFELSGRYTSLEGFETLLVERPEEKKEGNGTVHAEKEGENGLIGSVVQTVSKVENSVKTEITNTIQTNVEDVKEVVKDAKEDAQEAIESGKAAVAGLAESGKAAVAGLTESAKGAVSGITGSAMGVVQGVTETGSSVLSGLGNTGKSLVSGVTDSTLGLVNGVSDTSKEAVAAVEGSTTD